MGLIGEPANPSQPRRVAEPGNEGVTDEADSHVRTSNRHDLSLGKGRNGHSYVPCSTVWSAQTVPSGAASAGSALGVDWAQIVRAGRPASAPEPPTKRKVRNIHPMDELRRLNNLSDSMDEPLGTPIDRFGSRRSDKRPISKRLSDRKVAAARALAVGATSLGFLFAVAALLSVVLPMNVSAALLPGLVLIVIGAVAGHIARRARPVRVTVTQLIWRISPSAGCLFACIYAAVVFGNPANQSIPGLFLIGSLALAGVGTLWGIFCAFGAWLLTVVLDSASRKVVRPLMMTSTLAVGSLLGGLVGFLLLSSYRQTSLWALIFVLLDTAAVTVPVAIRLRIRPDKVGLDL